MPLNMPLKLPEHFPKFEMPVAVAFAAGACVSILAVLLLVYSFNSGPVKTSSIPVEKPTAENAPAPERENAEPESSQPSRIVGGAQQPNVSCESQTWPYIDQRCLTAAPPKDRVVSKPQPESDSLSPNIEVRPQPSPPDDKAVNQTAAAPAATDGAASASDRAVSVEPASRPEPASRSIQSAIPDRHNAVTGERAPARTEDAGNAVAKADSTNSEQAAPAIAAKASERAVAPRRKAKGNRARPARERTAGMKGGDPNRIVRRWREVEYEGPGGDTRKIIYVRPGTLQRDTYFQTAR